MFKVKYGFTAVKASILIAVIAILIVLVGISVVNFSLILPDQPDQNNGTIPNATTTTNTVPVSN